MRQSYVTLASYAALIILTPWIFGIFRAALGQFIPQAVHAAHPWISQLLAYIPVLALLFIFLKATLRPLDEHGFKHSNEYLWTSVALGVISAFTLYFMDSASGFFASINMSPDPTLLVAIGYIISWGVIGPLAEETFFRGLVQTTLQEQIKSDWKLHPAIILTVVLELLFHASFGIDWVQLAYVAVFGLAASIIYARTRSLTGPLIIHALGNAGELIIFWLL